MTNQPIEGTVNTSSVTIDRRIVTPCENCKNGCTMFNQSPCKCNCHQPIEEKWKGSWDRAVEDLSGIYYKKNSEEWYKELEEHLNWLVTAQFMENPYKFEKESPLVKKKKEEIIAFIENLLEQERKKLVKQIDSFPLSDSMFFDENNWEAGYKALEEFKLSIINK